MDLILRPISPTFSKLRHLLEKANSKVKNEIVNRSWTQDDTARLGKM